MVFSIIRLFPTARERGHVLEILRSVQELTNVQAGCLGCWLFPEDSLHKHVAYGEQWASEDDLYQHVGSDLYRRLLAAMELSQQAPEIHFHFVGETKGMELVEAVRTPSAPFANDDDIPKRRDDW